MSPSIVISLVFTAFIGGAFFYTYHEGVNHGGQLCEAEKLAAALEKSNNQLKLTKQLTEFQQEQISDAQTKLSESENEREALHKKLSELPDSVSECVPLSVLDTIRELRHKR